MVALFGTAGVLVVAALLAAGPPGRRGLALLVAMCAGVIPVVSSSAPPFRFLAAIGAIAGLARTIDLCREARSRSAPMRMFQALCVVDWRLAHRIPPRLEASLLVRAFVHLAITGVSMLAIHVAREHESAVTLVLGWTLAATSIWSLAEGLAALGDFAAHAIGWATPPLHAQPVRARSLRELWGSRWNLTVTRWLRLNVFAPLARKRHASLGVLVSFIVSALFHAYIAYAGGGATLALLMGTFFVVQAILVGAERLIRITRWPTPLQRAWMLSAMLLPSPLFTEPVIAIWLPSSSTLLPKHQPNVGR